MLSMNYRRFLELSKMNTSSVYNVMVGKLPVNFFSPRSVYIV